jgi:hypothetical protein
MSKAENGDAAVVAKMKPSAPGRETRELLQRASKGDESSRQAIRALLADGDRGRHYLESFGSSAEWLIRTIVRKAAGENIASQEAIIRKIESVRAELAGPDPTPMEKVLAE